jgi:hypothetical protein
MIRLNFQNNTQHNILHDRIKQDYNKVVTQILVYEKISLS